MDRIWELNKKKDIVCLILSYPPLNLVSKERHKAWIMDVLAITHKVRELKASSKEKEVNLLEVVSDITRLLYHSFHDIEAYLPHDMIEKMRKKTTESRMPKKEVLNLTIDFAIRQILEYIEIPELRRINISGIDDTRLVSRLKNLPSIRNMFDVIVLVSASNYKTIEEIEDSIARELGLSTLSTQQEVDELLKNKNFLILLNDIDHSIKLNDVGTNLWDLKNIQKIVSTSRFPGLHHMQVDLDIRIPENVRLESDFRVEEQISIVFGHLLATVLMARALKGVNNVRIWEYSSHALQLLPPSQTEDRILEGTDNVDLIGRWIKGSLIGSIDQGDEIIQNLVHALLLESFQNGNSVRMRDEIFKELVKLFKTEMNPMLLKLGGMELREAPVEEAWKEASSCELFMELPPEVGGLSHLELSIDVNPDDERWNVTVKDIVKEVCSLDRLDSLKLYLPEVILLNGLRNGSSSTKLSLIHYRFIVGSHMKRIISRLPPEIAGKFEEEERCLKYVNGEGVPTEIKEVLQHATALFLDRHLTLTSLSQFGIGNMENLKICVLGECNLIQTIVDTDNDGDVLLESLQYLNLHYMKNLRSIWKGPPGGRSLLGLKSLMLSTCPQLATVFTLNLLENLCHLEELVVEDCPEIKQLSDRRGRLVERLSWKKSEWLRIPNLDSIFVPIERDKDWMTQLAELNDRLKAWMQETKPSQPSGFGTSSNQKQVLGALSGHQTATSSSMSAGKLSLDLEL
ncbi:hypothetical protein CK203_059932 [Vitis vinifera]|uniref:Uncharacterized protein n=1 Tax=Vitis vinifera TaxID=29760 RepID=A0A438GNW3_VITVI|nr:hypothetical protein CK203_059932 [Vitis vinifera]